MLARPRLRQFVFAALLSARRRGRSEPRFFRIGTAATGGSFFEIGGMVASAISSPAGRACLRPRRQLRRAGPRRGGAGDAGLARESAADQRRPDRIRFRPGRSRRLGLYRQQPLCRSRARCRSCGRSPACFRRACTSSSGPTARSTRWPISPAKPCGLGEQGSGTNADARVLLAAAELGEHDLSRQLHVGRAQPAAALTGRFDRRVLSRRRPPDPGCSRAGRDGADPAGADRGRISSNAWQRISASTDLSVIPAGTYPGVDEETPSLGFFALWLVNADIDSDLVYAITKSLWSEATGSPAGGTDRLRSASTGPRAQRVVGAASPRRGALLPGSRHAVDETPQAPRQDGRDDEMTEPA